MKNIVRLALLSCLSLACAGARDMSRVEPLLFLPHQREIVLPLRTTAEAPPLIVATCNHGNRKSGRCSNVSVRLDAVLATSASSIDDRNRLIGLLLGVSDYNCSCFMNQAFGRKAQAQTANAILNSVTNTLAAKSQKSSSWMDLVQTAGKTANDVFALPSQLGSAETVVEIAIGDARKKLRHRIAERAHEDVATYGLLDALGDLSEYDEICSLQRGKELALAAAAAAAREEATQALQRILQQGGQPPAQAQQAAQQ